MSATHYAVRLLKAAIDMREDEKHWHSHSFPELPLPDHRWRNVENLIEYWRYYDLLREREPSRAKKRQKCPPPMKVTPLPYSCT